MHTVERVVLVVLGAVAFAVAVSAAKPPVNVSSDRLALRGFDAVAYVTDGRPLVGSSRFEAQWNGAVWRFATQSHREMFVAEPARYAPQFGGYCVYAVSQGYTADGDPRLWRIVEGRLYLNYSARAQRLWERDIPGHIAAGRANWPGVLAK